MGTKLRCQKGCSCAKVLTFCNQRGKKMKDKGKRSMPIPSSKISCANQARLAGILDGNSLQGAY